MLLCNEAAFQAKSIGQDSVLLKIDFRKAFDTLRWDFLYEAMAVMQSFSISRSVRQGCPLSPLLFTIAVQVLTDAVNSMLSTGHLKGIHLPEAGIQYAQGFFADDAHLLLLADRQNLLNAKSLLHTFGLASGLHVQWGKSTATWISTSNSLPQWTDELDWTWAQQGQVDKFLGFRFADGLDHNSIYETVLLKVKAKINCPLNKSTTIHGRIVIANHLILGILWFLLPLWSANRSKIRSIEALILRYIWGGNEDTKLRHRVAEVILYQKKSEGGLGLMSLQAQLLAFTAKTVRWAYTPGTHPLKTWLLAKFDSIAKLRLSLWGPKTPGVRNVTRTAKTGPNARLKVAGVEEIGHITHDGITDTPLQAAAYPNLPLTQPNCRAYNRLVQTTPAFTAQYRSNSQYVITNDTMSTWCFRLKDDAPADDTQVTAAHAASAFKINGATLVPASIRDLPTEASWIRAPVASFWTAQRKTPLRLLLEWQDRNTIHATLQWRDQSNFLSSPAATIRQLASTDSSKVQNRLRHWVSSHHIDTNSAKTWSKLWSKANPIKYSILQWYIFYQAVPTNTWRNPQAGRDQEITWCVCCSARSAEDVQHLFWTCPSILPLWNWAIHILHTAFPQTRGWSPSFKHAVLGSDPPDHCKAASKWWEKWRMVILWTIWTQRNERVFRNIQPSLPKAKALSWHRLLTFIRKEWAKHCRRAAALDLTVARRTELDRKIARRLVLGRLKISIAGHQLRATWRPP
ncbi:hypothetical protein R1sor_026947 [Riccia sorocarpa]|uniref:Reverse transcriptase domain-containing protein n=1 Tax=Riccia sorocarpa TaxID=122646 RepID=A0ABD3GIM0_9MARC